jgi:hypothetical protein
MVDHQELWRATSRKCQSQFDYVKSMRVRQKRSMFGILRSEPSLDVDTFLPHYGLTCGEFCVFQILTEHDRRESRKEEEQCGRGQGRATGSLKATNGGAS